MDADERDICIYLKSWPGQFVSGREISRRAGGKRRYREDANWAVAALSRLVERDFVESDTTGHFRLRRKAKLHSQQQQQQGRWVSPEIKVILQRSGKDFGQIIEIEEPEGFLADVEMQD
jgi:hypothetical protein